MERGMIALEQRAIVAESQNALLLASVESVRHELSAQRKMFEQWRSDILQDRSPPTEQIDKPTLTIPGRAHLTKSVKNIAINAGEQLDLYGSGGTKG